MKYLYKWSLDFSIMALIVAFLLEPKNIVFQIGFNIYWWMEVGFAVLSTLMLLTGMYSLTELFIKDEITPTGRFIFYLWLTIAMILLFNNFWVVGFLIIYREFRIQRVIQQIERS